MGIINKIINAYRRNFLSFEKQARKAGVKMGKNNFICSRFWSTEAYLITIGNYCAVTAGCKLFTHGGGHSVRWLNPKFDCFGKVVIGDYVYLGNEVLVMPGVTIGDHVLVAAGSVVTKSIPSNVVVGGNPAKFLCSIEDYYNRNKLYNLDSKDMDAASKKALLLSLPDEKFIHKSNLKIDKNS